jgi:hypothetical protein
MDPLTLNPYQFPPGPALDKLIHSQIFKASASVPFKPYSTSESGAAELRRELALLWGYPIVVGRSHIRHKSWFARCESDPSTCTEVLAETWPLAVARLAAIFVEKNK